MTYPPPSRPLRAVTRLSELATKLSLGAFVGAITGALFRAIRLCCNRGGSWCDRF